MKTGLFLIIVMMTFSLQINARSNESAKKSVTKMVYIKGGNYIPLFKKNGSTEKEQIKPFYLDIHAVTNEQYLQFVIV